MNSLESILDDDTLDLGVRHLEEAVLTQTSLNDQSVVVAVVDPFTRDILIDKTLETVQRLAHSQPELPILVVASDRLAAGAAERLAHLKNVFVAGSSDAFDVEKGQEIARMDVIEDLLAERRLLDRRTIIIKRKGLGLLDSLLGWLKDLIQIVFDENFHITVEDKIETGRVSKVGA